jgi:hypothetical protein
MNIINAKPTCLYYPIKVIFLDDDPEFLERLKVEFSSDINMLILTNPNAILHEINSYSENNPPTIFKLMNNIEVDTTNNHLFNFDVSNLLNLI